MQTITTTTNTRTRRATLALAVALPLMVGVLFALGATEAMADATDAGKNTGALLKGWALQLYGGVVAIVAIIFLVNKKYTELVLFFLAALLVGWLVSSPDSVAGAARDLGSKIFG